MIVNASGVKYRIVTNSDGTITVTPLVATPIKNEVKSVTLGLNSVIANYN